VRNPNAFQSTNPHRGGTATRSNSLNGSSTGGCGKRRPSHD
jgi:hypothetical protein